MTLAAAVIRHDWTRKEVHRLFELPFNDLLFRAQMAHRQHFPADEVQISTLLSIKTGACPGGLQVLPAERPLRHGPGARDPAGRGGGPRGGARRPGRWRDPLLHGRGMAQPERP